MVVPRFGLPLAALALALALCVAAAVATRTAERGGVARPWRGWGHSGTAPRELPEDTRVELVSRPVEANSRFLQGGVARTSALSKAGGKVKSGGFWWVDNIPWWMPPPPEWGPLPPTMFTAYYLPSDSAPMSTPNYGPLYEGRHPERSSYYPTGTNPVETGDGSTMDPALTPGS